MLPLAPELVKILFYFTRQQTEQESERRQPQQVSFKATTPSTIPCPGSTDWCPPAVSSSRSTQSRQRCLFKENDIWEVLWKQFGTDFLKIMQVAAMDDCRCSLIFRSGTVFTWVFNICAACVVIIFQNACWAALPVPGPAAMSGPCLVHVGSAH